MKLSNSNEHLSDVPIFSTTAAAASYKVANEGYVDLMFLRSHFVIDESVAPTDVPGSEHMSEQRANLIFSKVAAVTMTADQAKELINAIQIQLTSLATK